MLVGPRLMSRHPQAVQVDRDDPLLGHGPVPGRTVVEIRSRSPDSRELQLWISVLVMHGSYDALVPVSTKRCWATGATASTRARKRSTQPACIGVCMLIPAVGGSYEMPFALVKACTASSFVISGVVLIARIEPAAEVAMDTAAAVASSGSSTMATTSKSPNAR